jgi:hypothetical protein
MKKLIILILLISNMTVFSQKKESKDILDKGKLLYRLEKGSWYGTDLFLADYPNKRDSIGGYLSYEKDSKIYSIFFSRYDSNKVLARYKFDSIPKQKALDVELNTEATTIENSLIAIRQDAKNRAYENKNDFFSFYKKTSLNFIPLITNKEKQVYVITGPQISGVVLLGNDYLLTYNKNNEFKKKEKLHNTLIQFPYKSENKNNSAVSTIHTHILTKYITETDICTLLLYKNYVEWNQHFVIGEKDVSIFDLKKEVLIIMKKKAWEKINNAENK